MNLFPVRVQFRLNEKSNAKGEKIVMFKSVWKITSALALVALTTTSAAAVNIPVACPGSSIQTAIELAFPGDVIQVDDTGGPCEEDVLITTDGITVEGLGLDFDEVKGSFEIRGAQRVTIRSLEITERPVEPKFFGVHVTRGASAVLDGLIMSDHFIGIFLSRNAYADLLRVDVTNRADGENALSLVDNSAVRVDDSKLSSANPASDDGAAIGLFRSSSARIADDTLLQNTAGGLAIDVRHTSNLRVQSIPTNKIEGDVIIRNNSAASLREINVDGDITVSGDSNLTLRANSPVKVKVDGAIAIRDQSLLILGGAANTVTLKGGLTCQGPEGGVINFAAIVGGGGKKDHCSHF